ncbi:MAG TPA: glycosyltransferase [Candidatus Binataceae bacterium]|nr:glycosyltransferase [Candidatus Binataceae bacterium]
MKLSVIITTHARPDSLDRLLESLIPQLDPDRHELFIAENGTPQPSRIETGFAEMHIHDPLPGKCRVQNRAIVAAQGSIIVLLDDDLVVSRDYIAAVQHFFARYPEYAAMKGRILPAEDPWAKVGMMAPYLDLPIVDEGHEVIDVRGVLGANMAFRSSTFDHVGLFDERLGPGAAGHEEETEMSQRIRRAGMRIGYCPDALVYHDVDPERATRERYIRIARERGYCRTLHEHHTLSNAIAERTLAALRLKIARLMHAPVARIAREERRHAVAQGIIDGLRNPGPTSPQ